MELVRGFSLLISAVSNSIRRVFAFCSTSSPLSPLKSLQYGANHEIDSKRPKKYRVIPADLKQPRQAQLNLLAQKAHNDKKANNGKLPRDYYNSIMTPVARLTDLLQITKEDVRNQLRKLEKNAAKEASDAVSATQET